MHIVIDARSRPASTGRYVLFLLEHLQKIDKVNKYTILLQPTDSWRPTASNFTTVPCSSPQFSVNPLDQFKFAGLLYSLKPDVVHFAMTQQPLLYFGRIVTTTHDLTMFRYTRPGRHSRVFHFVRMRLYRLLFWWSHKKSKAIIVPSSYVARDLAKLQPFTKKKIIVTYESSEPPIAGKPQAVPGVRKPFIFHTGSPFPHKNIERLIDAFELVKQSHPKLQLVLSGKVEQYFEKLQKKIKKSPYTEDIIVTGWTEFPEQKWLYQNAEAYVLPSLSEGFGLPGMEAMAHGCPLVSSNATCLPEVYGDAALFFNPTNVEDMALKIERVLDDKAFVKELVAREKEQLKKYSWDKMARETLEIYTTVGRR
jgi:glycosyltransferase involved in cell wall biosynthesis